MKMAPRSLHKTMFKLGVFCLVLIASYIRQSDCQFHGELLKFKLAALNLPNCDFDFDGTSDPYAVFFTSSQRDGEQHRHWQKFGQTSAKKDTLNPVWDETLVYQYVQGMNQTWRIFIIDKDDSWYNPFDDPLGRVDVPVDGYLQEVRNSRKNNNGTSKPVQLFLSHPIGGVLIVTPIFE